MAREIRLGTLAVVTAVTFGVGLIAFALLTRDGSLVPAPPVIAAVLLLGIAGAVLYLARQVRQHVRRRRGRALDPLRAARTVALAQAAALTGAAAAGWYLGQLGVVLGDVSLVANRGRILPLIAQVLVAVALAVAGLVAQHWCRVDRGDDAREDRSDSQRDESRADRDHGRDVRGG